LERERVMTELGVAKSIQTRMLPSIPELVFGRDDIDLHAHMDTRREVRGAFYDAFFVGDNLLAVVIGDVSDVSDKNISAALLMSSTMMLIRNGANMLMKTEADPHKVFEAVNNALLHDSMKPSASVAAFMGCLDLTSGEFSYVNAGHDPPLKLGVGGEPDFVHTMPSPALAISKNQQYSKETIQFDAGDVLCLYSKGVMSAKHLLDIAKNCKVDSAKGLIDAVKEGLQVFTVGARQKSDMAMIALKFNKH